MEPADGHFKAFGRAGAHIFCAGGASLSEYVACERLEARLTTMSDDICLVLTTCPDRETAERLSAMLVEQRLAACVSAGAEVISTYPWQGRVEHESEIPLTIKTTRTRVDALKQELVAHHPYDVPELLVVSVSDGLDDYTQWIRDWTQ